MSVAIRNSFLSIAVFASIVLAALLLNGTPALVRSVERTAMTLASFTTERHPLTKHFGANSVIGPNGNLIGATSDPGIRSNWQREGLPE